MIRRFATLNRIVFACLIFLFSCSKSSKDNPPSSTAEISINNVTKERNTVSSTFTFDVTLSGQSNKDISVHYTTIEGTAKAGTDFTAASGTVTIPAGEIKANIDVTVTGDSLRQQNQSFYVQLDQPVNCTIKNKQGSGTIVNENGLYFPVDDAGYTTPGSYPGYTLAWADEFDGQTINIADWTYETGAGGWGNNELENYTNSPHNSFVSDGHLIIEARAETGTTTTYTSARMVTKNKKVFKWGRVDIRAKLPKTKGIWPALWMLGNNIDGTGWPACGEIDMMELLGQEPSKVYNTIHYGTSPATHESIGTDYSLTGESFDQQFHVFSMEWKEDSITMFVDDRKTFFCNRATVGNSYPFNNDFFFIFNIAVGGNWPGAPDATTEFPQRMIVDYVRVFQQ